MESELLSRRGGISQADKSRCGIPEQSERLWRLGWEIHHDAKKDAPSGTLLELLRTMERGGYTKKIDVSSNRAGKIRNASGSALTRLPIRSHSGTSPAAAMVLRRAP